MTWLLTWKEHSKGYTQLEFEYFYEAKDAMDQLRTHGKYNDFQLQEVPDKK